MARCSMDVSEVVDLTNAVIALLIALRLTLFIDLPLI